MKNGSKGSLQTVLLTGATGYLGSEIAARLLERDHRSILCPVRAPSAEQAAIRVREAVAATLGRPLDMRERERLRAVRGDIETAYFGLAPSVHDSLAADVEEVFHCAASTRLDRPLRDARWTNVRGVQTVYAFAAQAASQGSFRRFHHVSTAYVVGKTDGEIRPQPLSDDDRELGYRNTYEQTKAEAERWLQNRSILPTTIYRPTVIVGDSRTGRTTSWTAVHYAMSLMASKWIKFTPGESSSRLDCVPGDFVAEAILALGAPEESAGEVFHITSGANALSVHELVEYARRGIDRHFGDEYSAPKVLAPWRWRLTSAAGRCLASGRRRRAIDKYGKCEPYTRLRCVFENEREQRLLARAGVRIPQPSAFFPRTVDYALQHGFGTKREPPSRLADELLRSLRSNASLARRLIVGVPKPSSHRLQQAE
jgi:thioester reductase-like protein